MTIRYKGMQMTGSMKYKLLPAGGDTYSEIITKNNTMLIRLHI